MTRDPEPRLLTRIALRNYKSIAACDVRPGPLCFLVGANGSGKSNFLDALRFVSDALRYSLDHALRDRGGIREVRRRSRGHPTSFGVRLHFRLAASAGSYAFIVAARSRGGFVVKREDCLLTAGEPTREAHHYRVEEGKVLESTIASAPAGAADRLYLVNLSGLPQFRPLYDALSAMGFYNLDPQEIRQLQAPDPGDLLERHGSNLASVLASLQSRSPSLKRRVEEYLAKVTPGIVRIDPRAMGPKETIEFGQEVRGAKSAWRFPAASMSDGTLRALGVLVALFQAAEAGADRRRLIGIEEPEIALHPAAAGVLTDALREASDEVQVLVTSHSPDLLDDEEIADSAILAVQSDHGETTIGPLDEVGRSALRDRLYTAGELLRMDQLRPDPERSRPRQRDIFSPEP